MSVFRDINERFNELYDGEDETTLLDDLVESLPEAERSLWEEEATFYIEKLPEHAGAEDPYKAIEPLIMAKFENQAT